MKDGYVIPTNIAEMSEINRYTRREYQPEEVYAFSLVLCDNEIDRDFERFSIPALEKLKELFLGKTCILDNERKSANQNARIFHTEVETEEGRVTQAGEPYTRLTARAYLPRTERTRETIELIDSGILKEVSVCGKERCAHQKGRTYGGKLCCRVLEDPTDAYECSFVAVPVKRENEVRRSFQKPESIQNAQWISIYERKPEPYETVLIAVRSRNGYNQPVYFVAIGGLVKKAWESFTGGLMDMESVTYWMPLPKPPEVKA